MKNNFIRRQREKREIRLRILDAARELFVSGGEEALTLRRVAHRIEYSATTIYLHFADKETLVRELCAADFAVFSRVLIQAERIADPMDRLSKVAAAYIDFGLQYPSHYRVMFMTSDGARPGGRTKKSAAVATAEPSVRTEAGEGSPAAPEEKSSPYHFLKSAVFKAIAAGCFKPEYRDIELITQALWSGLHGVVSLHLVRARHSGVSWRPVQAAADVVIECLLNGLSVPAVAVQPSWRK